VRKRIYCKEERRSFSSCLEGD